MLINADFTFKRSKRTNIFLKKTADCAISKGSTWTCHCEMVNELTEAKDQYCPKCGTHLRIQEQREDSNGFKEIPGAKHVTIVRVAHFQVKEVQDGQS